MAGITLVTLGDQEVGKDTIPFDFGKVFNLPDINRETSFYKLKTLS